MANKYTIEIGMKRDPRSMGDLRRQVQQSKTMGAGQIPSLRRDQRQQQTSMSQMSRALLAVQKALQENTKAIVENTRTLGGAGRGGGIGGGGGRRPGGGILGGAGGGRAFGGVGAALPIVGAVFGILGFAISQITKIGRAHLQAAGQQVQTAGIAGTQAGRGIYMGAQMGQLVQQRRLAAGTYVAGGAGGMKKVEGRWRREGVGQEGIETAMTYGKLFGAGAGEMGKTLGLMDLLTGGRGGKQFERVIKDAHAAGVQTEMPLLVQSITKSMEEAVEAGVNASNLATDMATEISKTAEYSPNKSVRSAIALTRNLMQLQERVSKGEYSTPAGWRMFAAGRKKVREAILGGGDAGEGARLLGSMIKEKVMSPELVSKFQEKGAVSPVMEEFLTRWFLEKRPVSAQTAFRQDVVPTLAGKGGSREEQLARWARQARVMGIAPEISRAITMFGMARGEKAEKIDRERLQRGEFGAGVGERGGLAFRARTLQISQENLVLFNAAAVAAGSTMIKFNRALLQSATALENTLGISEKIISLGNGIEKIGRKLTEVMKEIEEKGVMEFFIDLINPFS